MIVLKTNYIKYAMASKYWYIVNEPSDTGVDSHILASVFKDSKQIKVNSDDISKHFTIVNTKYDDWHLNCKEFAGALNAKSMILSFATMLILGMLSLGLIFTFEPIKYNPLAYVIAISLSLGVAKIVERYTELPVLPSDRCITDGFRLVIKKYN